MLTDEPFHSPSPFKNDFLLLEFTLHHLHTLVVARSGKPSASFAVFKHDKSKLLIRANFC